MLEKAGIEPSDVLMFKGIAAQGKRKGNGCHQTVAKIKKQGLPSYASTRELLWKPWSL
jgi:hypothetical protein